MKRFHLAFFYFIFFTISIIEGVHFILDLRFLYFFLFITPFFLFMLDPQARYRVPKKFIWISSVYLIFSFISLIYSKQIGISIELFLRDLSLFLITLYVVTHADEIRYTLPRAIVFLSLIYVVVSFMCFLTPDGREFIRGVRLNLLFNPAYPHKTIGDYVTFGIIIASYFFFIEKRRQWKYALFILFPIFVLSFSRTAFITLGFVAVVMLWLNRAHFKKYPKLLIVSLATNFLLLIFGFVAITTRTGKTNTFIHYVQTNLQDILFMFPRPFDLSRIPFWKIGWEGLIHYPFTGVGQGGFQFLSYRFMSELFLSSFTSFNLFVDLASEQGVFVALCFATLLIYVLISAKKRTVFYFLLIGMIVSFMGFSAYVYTQIWLLFFICIGLNLHAESRDYYDFDKRMLYIPAVSGIVYIQVLLAHTVLVYNDMPDVAHTIYPFNPSTLTRLININMLYKHNEEKVAKYLKQYEHIAALDANSLEYIGDRYVMLGKNYQVDAIRAYEESFTWGKYAYGGALIPRMTKLYNLKKHIEGKQAARAYVKTFLDDYYSLLNKDNKEIQGALYDQLMYTFKNEYK